MGCRTINPIGVDMGDWTVDTLRIYLQRQHDDLIARLDERHAAQSIALTKAEAADERRFASVNEFRAQLSDQSATFLTRNEYDAKHEALASRVEELSRQVTLMAGRTAGVKLSAGALVGGLSGLAAFITLVIILANILTGH